MRRRSEVQAACVAWVAFKLSTLTMELHKLAALVLWLTCLIAWVQGFEAAAPAVNVPAIILFGDSTVDVGNNNFLNTIAKSNFLPYGRDFDTKTPTGRFTDGRMVSDFMASKLGLPMSLPYLHPNATGQNLIYGTNFASAASGYLDTTSVFLNVIPASRQLEMFDEYKIKLSKVVGPEKSSSIISQALYFVSSGSNDFILNYFVNPALQSSYSPTEFNAALMSTQTEFVQKLYQAGARKIGIFGFPPIGCIPAQITLFGIDVNQKTCVEEQNAIASAYNSDLAAAIPKWQSNLSGSLLLYLDAYSMLYDIFNNPTKYGYTEARRACCGEGLLSTAGFCNKDSVGTCTDASKYVFFDSLHPTSSVYRLVAEAYHEKVISYLL